MNWWDTIWCLLLEEMSWISTCTCYHRNILKRHPQRLAQWHTVSGGFLPSFFSIPTFLPSYLLCCCPRMTPSLDLTFCSFLRWFPWGSNFLLAFYQPNWNWDNHGWLFHVASFCASIIPRWHYPLKLLLILHSEEMAIVAVRTELGL